MADLFMGGGADHVGRYLVERRGDVYGQVAKLVMGLEEAVDDDDALRARYLLADLRRTLRGALAFLSDEVYAELERLEALGDALPEDEREGPIPSALRPELSDRLQLLHVKMARVLRLPQMQDMEQIVGLPARLKQRLAEERAELEARGRQRELEEQCWKHEAEARELIGRREHAKAVKCLRRAVRLDPTRAVFRNDLGVVLSLLGRNEEAVEEYRAAVALNERHPQRRTEEWTTSYYNLGVALRKLATEGLSGGIPGRAGLERLAQRLSEAQAAFEEYTRLNATGPKVREARELIATCAGQLTELRAALTAQRATEPASG